VVYIVIYTDCFDFYCCFTVIFTMGSSSSDRISIQKLKGASNYEVWALRTEAFLIKEGLKEAISSDLFDLEEDINDKALANIKLLVEDGPLLQIQHISTALEAWESFKNLYSPKGFTSEFLICREFFNTTLDNLSSMEEYLNKVKQLSDQLKAKQLELPKQVIIAWVLNSLTDEYEGFVSNITQSLRNDSEIFTLETLFSNLLDESKRQDNKDSNNQALFTYNKDNRKYKGKKPYKITKGKYCKYCKLPSHDAKDCYFLFPSKAPKSWNKDNNLDNSPNKYSNNSKDKHPRDTRDDNIDVLHSNAPSLEPDLDTNIEMDDYNFEDIQVFNTTYNPNNNNNTDPLIDKLVPLIEHLTHERSNIDKIKVFNTTVNNNYTANFILDCAATKHIISNKDYFHSIKQCNKQVNWGKAKSILIKGIGDVNIHFIDTKIKCILKNCLYMPEIGINLISQGELNKETYTILTHDSIIIKQNNKVITKGKKLQNLYYLPIKVLNTQERILNISTNTSTNTNTNTNTNTSTSTSNNSNLIWHQRLGHINKECLDKLQVSTIGYNTSNTSKDINYKITECETCLRAKFTNKINHNTNNSIHFQYLSKVASDLCGPITPLTYNNYRYFITFLDKATRYLEVQLLRTKDEAFNAFYNFKQQAENNKENHKIRIYATDNGKEFVNNKFKKILLNSGIKHQLSPAYTHEPNGFVERINQTIMNRVRSLLYNSNTPSYLWGEALLASVYLYNRTPHTSISHKTPYELKYNEKPNISNIKV
jgi:hypothetical protein